MELLYVWIENDGRNIQDCGFNFSFEFDIQFEHIWEEDKGILTVRKADNPHVIEGLFNRFCPKDSQCDIVNISAIIGRNGVGKSNLMEYLVKIFSNPSLEEDRWLGLFKDGEKLICLHTLTYPTLSFGTSLEDIQTDNVLEDVLIDSNIDLPIVLPQTHDIMFISVFRNSFLKNCTIYYSPILDFRSTNLVYEQPVTINGIKTPPFSNISSNYLLIDDTKHIEAKVDMIEAHKYKNMERQMNLIESGLLETSQINIPQEVTVTLRNIDLDFSESTKLSPQAKEVWKHYHKIIKERLIESLKSDRKEETSQVMELRFLLAFLSNFFLNLEQAEDIPPKYNLPPVINFDKKVSSLEIFLEFIKNQNFIKSGISDFFYKLARSFFSLKTFDISLQNGFRTTFDETRLIYGLYLEYLAAVEEKVGYKAQGFIDFSWRDLSSGEKAFLDLFSRLFFAKQEMKKLQKEDAFIHLIIDEGELGFHPQWQKEYLNRLIKFIQLCFPNNKVQIFLTSHSPFLTSDLPKENIIFLDRKEDFTTRVLSNQEKEEQTFGGNIYQLFADTFYLQNGIVGEFSKSIIQEVIEWLKDKENSNVNEAYAEKVINMIGEPIIRGKLKELLEAKKGMI